MAILLRGVHLLKVVGHKGKRVMKSSRIFVKLLNFISNQIQPNYLSQPIFQRYENLSDSQESLFHFFIFQKLAACSLEHNTAIFQNIGAMTHAKGLSYILFH